MVTYNKSDTIKNPNIPKRDALISYASVVAGKRKYTSGGGVEGKNKSALVGVKILSDFSRNTCKKSILGQREQLGAKLLSDLSRNNRDTCKVSTLGQRELLRAKVLSTIKGIESDGIKSKLSLDHFMRMEHGLDGRWAIVWSKVYEVGPKVLQPIKPTGHNFIYSSLFNTAKPKSVWRSRQSQTLKPMVIPLPLESQVGASSSGDEMMMMRVCGGPVTGKESESRCSSDIANLNPAMARIEPPSLKEMSPIPCRHPWVGLNRFSPLLDLGNGMEAMFGEGEAHEEDRSSLIMIRCNRG
ncbi:hypothetical protein SO802_023860 [Lithocarpus litseifolius]|uniref:Uncharacterized protein n=1 Tax=Lithocarpus litseifolius TaxID=425828 RepID=A0AAW2C9Z9_9ROSI